MVGFSMGNLCNYVEEERGDKSLPALFQGAPPFFTQSKVMMDACSPNATELARQMPELYEKARRANICFDYINGNCSKAMCFYRHCMPGSLDDVKLRFTRDECFGVRGLLAGRGKEFAGSAASGVPRHLLFIHEHRPLRSCLVSILPFAQ